jgi:hypothetical protein
MNKGYPRTSIVILWYLYHKYPEFSSVWVSSYYNSILSYEEVLAVYHRHLSYLEGYKNSCEI